VHFCLNTRVIAGVPHFVDRTEEIGLAYKFPSWSSERRQLKHAHVEAADFDDDTWVALFVAVVFRAGDRLLPFICRNLGVRKGTVRFETPPVDQAEEYFAAGPVLDVDRDGRLDAVCCTWWSDRPSYLFLNKSARRNWLSVRVVPEQGNSMGIGSLAELYLPGTKKLVGMEWIKASDGFCTCIEAEAHFVLADVGKVDLEVRPPGKSPPLLLRNVSVNRRIVIGRQRKAF